MDKYSSNDDPNFDFETWEELIGRGLSKLEQNIERKERILKALPAKSTLFSVNILLQESRDALESRRKAIGEIREIMSKFHDDSLDFKLSALVTDFYARQSETGLPINGDGNLTLQITSDIENHSNNKKPSESSPPKSKRLRSSIDTKGTSQASLSVTLPLTYSDALNNNDIPAAVEDDITIEESSFEMNEYDSNEPETSLNTTKGSTSSISFPDRKRETTVSTRNGTEIEKHRCPICLLNFYDKTVLLKHRKEHDLTQVQFETLIERFSKEQMRIRPVNESMIYGVSEKFICEICGSIKSSFHQTQNGVFICRPCLNVYHHFRTKPTQLHCLNDGLCFDYLRKGGYGYEERQIQCKACVLAMCFMKIPFRKLNNLYRARLALQPKIFGSEEPVYFEPFEVRFTRLGLRFEGRDINDSAEKNPPMIDVPGKTFICIICFEQKSWKLRTSKYGPGCCTRCVKEVETFEKTPKIYICGNYWMCLPIAPRPEKKGDDRICSACVIRRAFRQLNLPQKLPDKIFRFMPVTLEESAEYKRKQRLSTSEHSATSQE